MTDGRGPQRMTRAQFSDDQLDVLVRAFEVTRQIMLLAARRVAEQLRREDLSASETAQLVGRATRLGSAVRRDLVRFLPPDTPATIGDLEKQILADAMAPGVPLEERVRALDSLLRHSTIAADSSLLAMFAGWSLEDQQRYAETGLKPGEVAEAEAEPEQR